MAIYPWNENKCQSKLTIDILSNDRKNLRRKRFESVVGGGGYRQGRQGKSDVLFAKKLTEFSLQTA